MTQDTMTHREVVEAARALETWLKTQVPGRYRAIVASYYLAFETVAQSVDSKYQVDPDRIEEGSKIVVNMYCHYMKEIIHCAGGLQK